MAKPNGWSTVKIPTPIYGQVRRLVARVRKHGWVTVRSKRSEAPTIGAVIAEAVERLAS